MTSSMKNSETIGRSDNQNYQERVKDLEAQVEALKKLLADKEKEIEDLKIGK